MPICETLSIQDATAIPQVMRYGQMVSGLAPFSITPTGSPFTYQNSASNPMDVLISGGTVTTISVSRDGSTFFLVGLLAGMFHLAPGDSVRIVYIIAPVMTGLPF